MGTDYAETEVSKRARDYIRQLPQHSNTALHYRQGFFEYSPQLRGRLSTQAGDLDISKAYRALGASRQQTRFIALCIQLNLSEQESHAVVKERFMRSYSHWPIQEQVRTIVDKTYPRWCEPIGIQPDYTDWYSQSLQQKEAELQTILMGRPPRLK